MPTALETLDRLTWQGEIKLYIKNDAGTYVDYSDRYGEDRLLKLPAIHHMAEGKYGQPVTKPITVTVDNADRFWDKTPPAGVTSFLGKEVQIRVMIAEVSAEQTLATFRIAPDGIETSDGPTAKLRLEPLTEVLRRGDASSLRRGLQKHEFKSWIFLVQELIRGDFGDSSGDLPGTYSFPSDPRFIYPDGNKHFSVWGKPPQWDGADWNEDNIEIPRDLDYDFTNDITYVAVGKDLWEYNVSTDTWTNRGEHASNGNGVTAKYVRDFGNGVLVCKWDMGTGSAFPVTLYVNVWDKVAVGWHATTKSSAADFSPGSWVAYAGFNTVGLTYVKGDDDAGTHRGTNLIVPFQQRFYSGKSPQFKPSTGIHSNTNTSPAYTNYSSSTQFVDPWWFCFNGVTVLDVASSWGQRIAIDVFETSSTAIKLYYATWDNAAQKGNIAEMAITIGSVPTKTQVILASGIGTNDQFIGLRVEVTNERLAYVRVTEKTGSGLEDITSLRFYNLTAGLGNADVEIITNNSLDTDNYSYIIESISDSLKFSPTAYDWIIMQVMEVDRITKYPTYKIVHISDPEGTPVYTTLNASMSYFRCEKRPNKSANNPHWMDTQTGGIWVNKSTATVVASTQIDSGRPAVFDSPFTPGFVVENTGTDPDIFGLSFPFHDPDTQAITPDGKYYMWQYTTKHTGRVELGDFDDMNRLEAVSKLASAFQHSVYVDRPGNWIAEARDPSTVPTVTIAKDAPHAKGWISIKKRKPTAIQNFIQTVPYEARLAPMQTKFYQKSTSTFNGTITATQLDRGRRRVKMRCIKGGLVSSGNTRYDFLTFFDTIETRLGAAYVSGTSVTVENVTDIAVGDTIRVRDSAEKTITAVTVATKVLTIDAGFSDGYEILSEVVISKAGENKWSSQGLTLLDGAINNTVTTVTVDDTSNIVVGNFLLIDEEEMEVTQVIDATDLVVVRGDNAAAQSDNASVSVIIKVAGFSKSYEIGGQRIGFVFSMDVGTNTENAIAEGDFFEFISEGMKLEKARGSLIQQSDQTSIEKNTKSKKRRTLDNRFLTPVLGEFKLNTIVTRYKDEKRAVTFSTPFDLQFLLFGTLKLVSEEIFPSDALNMVNQIVRETILDPINNKTTYIVEEQ